MNAPLTSLFVPSAGIKPPFLAGRSREMKALRGALEAATEGKGRPVVMVGPRGNGKTALISAFRRKCEEEEIEVRADDADQFGADRASFSRWVLGKRLARKIESAEIKAFAASLSASWKKPDAAAAAVEGFRNALLASTEKKPLVALIDEAHTMPPDMLKFALNAAQTVNRKGGKFLLVLAGTPHLRGALFRAKASFWNRSEKIGVGRISAGAAADALRNPLAERGVGFDEGALQTVVEESQRYPYFVQLWGEALCAASSESGETRIDMRTVEAARPAIERGRTEYYEDRYSELDKEKLAVAAALAAEAMRGRRGITLPALRAMMARASNRSESEIAPDLDKLHDLGFVWRPPGGRIVEPGIPSLMAYVVASLESDRLASRSPDGCASRPEVS